jgi:hypothetical protein
MQHVVVATIELAFNVKGCVDLHGTGGYFATHGRPSAFAEMEKHKWALRRRKFMHCQGVLTVYRHGLAALRTRRKNHAAGAGCASRGAGAGHLDYGAMDIKECAAKAMECIESLSERNLISEEGMRQLSIHIKNIYESAPREDAKYENLADVISYDASIMFLSFPTLLLYDPAFLKLVIIKRMQNVGVRFPQLRHVIRDVDGATLKETRIEDNDMWISKLIHTFFHKNEIQGELDDRHLTLAGVATAQCLLIYYGTQRCISEVFQQIDRLTSRSTFFSLLPQLFALIWLGQTIDVVNEHCYTIEHMFKFEGDVVVDTYLEEAVDRMHELYMKVEQYVPRDQIRCEFFRHLKQYFTPNSPRQMAVAAYLDKTLVYAHETRARSLIATKMIGLFAILQEDGIGLFINWVSRPVESAYPHYGRLEERPP